MAPKMKKPPPPPPQQQEKEASLEEEEEGEEDSSEAIPEGNAPADEVAASLRPKKSKLYGEVAASPKPKKTSPAPSPAPKRAKKAAPSQEEDGSEEHPQEESGEASAEMDPSAIETTAASSPRKPSGEIVAPPQHNKKRAAASPVSKRAKKPTPPLEEEQRSDEEVEVEAEEESGHTRPVTNARADKTATQRKRNKPSGANAASPERKKRGKPSAKSPPRSKRDKAASNDEEVEQEKEQAEEDGADNSGEALLERNASLAKLPGSKREKKPAVERSWSMEDELRILTTLAEHAQTHGGAQLEASDLFATLAASFDRRDADTSKLANKVRKLKGRHERVRSQGCPADGHGRQLFELCEIVWGSGTLQNSIQGASMAPRRSLRNTSSSGHVVPGEAHQEGGGGGEHIDAPTGTLVVDVGACKDNSVPFVKDGDANSGKFEDNGGQVDEDEQVKVTFVRREFSELSILYPDLAKEVKGYAASHNSGELIMSAFETIGDDEARDLDARCKKQKIDMFNLEMSQAELTKALLCTFAGLIN